MEELKLKTKIEDFIKYMYIALRQFPKSERFTLAADIKRSLFNLLELVIRCNFSRDKTKYFLDIDTELEILKTKIRLSKDLEFLPFKKYEICCQYLTEIGKIFGGWSKKFRGKAV